MPAPKELDPSTSLEALYGVKLRKLRSRAGWTQQELGDKVPIAHSRIAQFELGNESPTKDVSDALDVLLGADGDLSDLWEHIQRTPFPNWSRKYMRLEAKAIKMRKYMAHTVPGLLQTEAYARELLHAARPNVAVEELLAARLDRQKLLAVGNPPTLWVVLDEAVLRRQVGSASIMRAQLAHLLRAQEASERVVVQVLPFRQGAHPAMGGSITVLSFRHRSDVVYLEGSHSGELVEQPEQVAGYELAFDHLQAQALSQRASVDLIRTVMEDTYGDPRLPTRSGRRKLAQEQLQQYAGRRLHRGGPRLPRLRPGA
ncbi:Scr1 family TA system antitoxin-like transcriptional regulator [Streptomyces rimosus]|uniref:helix-turn-helix domain-containing protein n=1 Tax=Streptomyces rimosus TaxID=1927 RepID=UPI0004C8330B|nr:Scr1 family TA system antitoxin-like transcriptional regulator [Streptomyces rimosus]